MPPFAIASRKKRALIRLPTSRPNRSGSAVTTVWMRPSAAACVGPSSARPPQAGSGVFTLRWPEQRQARGRHLLRGCGRMLVGEARVAEAVLEARPAAAQPLEREVAE